jgi:hypothetical protein
VSSHVFKSLCSNWQYLSHREQQKLIKMYNRARDDYIRAGLKAQQAYDELARRGWVEPRGQFRDANLNRESSQITDEPDILSTDNEKSKQ